jgi:hypothetical protein
MTTITTTKCTTSTNTTTATTIPRPIIVNKGGTAKRSSFETEKRIAQLRKAGLAISSGSSYSAKNNKDPAVTAVRRGSIVVPPPPPPPTTTTTMPASLTPRPPHSHSQLLLQDGVAPSPEFLSSSSSSLSKKKPSPLSFSLTRSKTVTTSNKQKQKDNDAANTNRKKLYRPSPQPDPIIEILASPPPPLLASSSSSSSSSSSHHHHHHHRRCPDYNGMRVSIEEYPDPEMSPFNWRYIDSCEERCVEYFEKYFDFGDSEAHHHHHRSNIGVVKLEFYYTTGTIKAYMLNPDNNERSSSSSSSSSSLSSSLSSSSLLVFVKGSVSKSLSPKIYRRILMNPLQCTITRSSVVTSAASVTAVSTISGCSIGRKYY